MDWYEVLQNLNSFELFEEALQEVLNSQSYKSDSK